MPLNNANLIVTFQYVTSDSEPLPTASLTITRADTDEQLAVCVETPGPFDSLDEIYARLIEASRKRQQLIW